jgi:hypothetical protein
MSSSLWLRRRDSINERAAACHAISRYSLLFRKQPGDQIWIVFVVHIAVRTKIVGNFVIVEIARMARSYNTWANPPVGARHARER